MDERYERALRAQNVVDFDDLLLLTQRLFETEHALLERLRARWRYLMIDEYQDTNGAQFNLMKLLAGSSETSAYGGRRSVHLWLARRR